MSRQGETNGRDPEEIPELANAPLRVAAFNIQIFGRRKVGKKNVTSILAKILTRYDIILIQEIRDSQGASLDNLLKVINKVDIDDPFSVEVSERLGRSHCKEQYAFIYRPSRVSVTGVYQYDDGVDDGTDAFQREPFAVRFSSPNTGLKDFGIIAIHTSPKRAVEEINALQKVYDTTKEHWGLEDLIIAGDFNADGDYVDSGDWKRISLRSDRRFTWLIKDNADTTVGSTDCSYDRFVVAGKKLLKAVVPGSTKVFKFDKEFDLTQEEAEDVSDHYPIELQIAGEVNTKLQRHIDSDISLNIRQRDEVAQLEDVRRIYRTGEKHGYVCDVKKELTCMLEVVATKRDVKDVTEELQNFRKLFPGVLRTETVSVVAAYLRSPVLDEVPYVYGLIVNGKTSKFTVTVTCRLKEPLTCVVSVQKSVS